MAMLPLWRRYTETALAYLPPEGDVLEVGPGPGVLLTSMARTHPLCVGVDLSRGMLRHARRRLQDHGLPAHVVQADAVALPIAAGVFDAVVMTFALSAIPDGHGALAEVARVLRPGGVVILVDACVPVRPNRPAIWLAGLWRRFGDHFRSEATLMCEAGLTVQASREFGAFHSIRVTVGKRP